MKIVCVTVAIHRAGGTVTIEELMKILPPMVDTAAKAIPSWKYKEQSENKIKSKLHRALKEAGFDMLDGKNLISLSKICL